MAETLEKRPPTLQASSELELASIDDQAWSDPETRFPGIAHLMQEIRRHLAGAPGQFQTKLSLPFDAVPKCQLYVTLFQGGLASLRWGTTVDTLSDSLERIVTRLRDNPTFARFAVADPRQTAILLEYMTSARPVPSVELLREDQLSPFRFEPGITGLTFRSDGKAVFYMPTEAFTRSHMTLDQVFGYLAKRVGVKTPSLAERVRLTKAKMSAVQIIESRAYLASGDKVLELYRGYPKRQAPTKDEIYNSMVASVDWIVRNQKPSGKFLYYYDASTGSTADFQHPDNPGYYNILRHGGGTITLLRVHELAGDPTYLAPARQSLAYLIEHSRTYERQGRTCRYVFDNQKAKLGGTGIGLVSLMHHYRLMGESAHLQHAGEMVDHLLTQIDEAGEFIGYYIHPLFNGGQPLQDVSDEDRRKLFSFYYPGEALLGMALYEKFAPTDEARRAEIRAAGRKALDFLVHVRPKRYADLFLSLPADGWLMQAIEEWWPNPEMRDPGYSQFVYSDAEQMVAHMYNEQNSPYPDYVGNFFYAHGQHAIPDGSRAEGLIAAYILARNEGRVELQAKLLKHCCMAAAGLMHTYNSRESTYATADPERATGAFRFKLTRQWLRVDSIQHTACFFARLLPFL